MNSRDCMSCGDSATSIVIFPYTKGDLNGRLLMYCDTHAGRPDLLVRLPIRLLDEDDVGTLEFLYRHRLTLTDPSLVAEHFDVPARGPWFETAVREVQESN